MEEPAPGRSQAKPEDRDGIVRSSVVFADFLQQVGGTCLVVRAMPSAWSAPLTEESLENAAACWDAVGKATAERGIGLALHVDFLSSLSSLDDIASLIERTDARHVGLALDTAELFVAGIDPLETVRRLGSRVVHVHLKDARDRVGDDRATKDAEKHVLLAGGSSGLERWFWELGEGAVDVDAVVGQLREEGYRGWFVVESDQSPDPAGSVLLNGWTMQRLRAGR